MNEHSRKDMSVINELDKRALTFLKMQIISSLAILSKVALVYTVQSQASFDKIDILIATSVFYIFSGIALYLFRKQYVEKKYNFGRSPRGVYLPPTITFSALCILVLLFG